MGGRGGSSGLKKMMAEPWVGTQKQIDYAKNIIAKASDKIEEIIKKQKKELAHSNAIRKKAGYAPREESEELRQWKAAKISLSVMRNASEVIDIEKQGGVYKLVRDVVYNNGFDTSILDKKRRKKRK